MDAAVTNSTLPPKGVSCYLHFAMNIIRAYKTELDPNNVQRTMFLRCAGTARFIFNWALADRKERWEQGQQNTNLYEQKRRFNAMKREQWPWLYEVPYTVQESAFANLDTAYQNFFRRVKQSLQEPGYPKFKSRKQGIGSFTLRGSIHVEQGQIKLPRIGWVKLKEREYLPSEQQVKLLSVTISERAGRWYASVQVEEDGPEPEMGKDTIGVDLGISHLAVCSDGMVFENPKALVNAQRKLTRLQREFSRRSQGGQNWHKTKAKIARCHAKIANVRQHALHQVSHYVTAKAKPETVVIEDLNVKGMLQNHHLAKAVSDASFGELRRQIEYKAKWYGINVVVAGRFWPSSKTCSRCGCVKDNLTLADRTYTCDDCGLVIDRDLNAALNLAAYGRNRQTDGDCLGKRTEYGQSEPGTEQPIVAEVSDGTL